MIPRRQWLIGIAALLVIAMAGYRLLVPSTSPPAATPPATPSATAGVLAALQGTLEHIYTQVNPSVVNVKVEERRVVRSTALPETSDLRSRRSASPQEGEERIRLGVGSGFVWDTAGHIVTNNHVVDGADRITVTLYDGTAVSAKVVGTDPDSDLAVAHVDLPADRLRPVQLADSTQVKVGQLVTAFGNPFGLQSTMTVGFISALGRALPVGPDGEHGPSYTIADVLQTDAPMNPGNSGGVLVDDAGRVIGVPLAIVSPAGVSAGIGFAIPSAVVQKVVPALIQTGRYEHAWLGVSGTSLTPALATAMGLKPEQRGALVVDVVPGSPADQAGLRGSDRQVTIDDERVRLGGDVIVALDGQPVKGVDDLVTDLARRTEVGQTVSLTVLNHGQEHVVKVTLAARPTSGAPQGRAESRTADGASLGIRGLTLTPEVARALHLPADQQGVLVEQVERGGPADQAGVRGGAKRVVTQGLRLPAGGDVITALDGQPVTGMEDLQALLQLAYPGQQVGLTLLRAGHRVQVEVMLGERHATRR
jgi:serine protease Do